MNDYWGLWFPHDFIDAETVVPRQMMQLLWMGTEQLRIQWEQTIAQDKEKKATIKREAETSYAAVVEGSKKRRASIQEAAIL